MVATLELSVVICPVAVARLFVRVVSALILLVISVARLPERVAMFPVAVARLAFVVARLPERVAMLPVAVATLELVALMLFWRRVSAVVTKAVVAS
jgi:hypothetical protein